MNTPNPPMGQLLEWVLPNGGMDTNGNPVDQYQVFFINKYADSISVYNEYVNTNTGLDLTNLVYRQEIPLPDSYSNYKINTLDIIDLNSFKNQDNTNTYVPALMIWCKSPTDPTGGKYGFSLNMLQAAPSTLLACTVTNAEEIDEANGNTYEDEYLTLNNPNSAPTFGINISENLGRRSKYSLVGKNVSGGFITAPNAKGQLCYYYTYSTIFATEGQFTGPSGDSENKTQRKSQVDVAAMGINVTNNVFPYIDSNNISTVAIFTTYENPDNITQKNFFLKYDAYNPGPQIVFDGDTDQTVRINPALQNLTLKNASLRGANKIGIAANLSDSTIKGINNSMKIEGGAIPIDIMDRLARLKYTQGVKVLRVILGWPYCAVPQDTNGSINLADIMKASSFNLKNDATTIDQKSFNNGVAATAELGYGSKAIPGLEFSFGVKSSYEYKNEKTTNKELTIGVNVIYPPANSPNAVLAGYQNGFVINSRVMPALSRYISIIPQKGALPASLTVGGDTNTFLFTTTAMQFKMPGTKYEIQAFCGTNPSISPVTSMYTDTADGNTTNASDTNAGQFTTDVAALSAGLPSRTVSSLIQVSTNAGGGLYPQLDAIRSWQTNTPIIPDLTGLGTNSGIQGVGGTEGDGMYRIPFNLATTISITKGATTITTKNHQYAAGLYWSFSAGIATKGDIQYKGGQSDVLTVKDGEGITIQTPGYDAPSSSRDYYLYSIDVPALKSYMASHTYTLYTGSTNQVSYTNQVVRPYFIPAYCWTYDQSFELGVPWIPNANQN